MFFCDIKFRKEIETLNFVRNLSNIAIGAICWQMTGSRKIGNLKGNFIRKKRNIIDRIIGQLFPITWTYIFKIFLLLGGVTLLFDVSFIKTAPKRLTDRKGIRRN